MLNTFAAAWKLTCYQLLSKKQLWFTCILLIVPIVASLAVRQGVRFNPDLAYPRMVGMLLANVLIPFVGLLWGTTLLTDEIDGKTLVYLWTRPHGRATLFAARALLLAVCLAIFSFTAVTSVYLCIFAGQKSVDNLWSNAAMIIWDTRALALGATAYAAAGLLLASLFKRALVVGLVYVYAIDGVSQVLPGFLRKLSLRHYVLSLTTHPDVQRPKGVLKLLEISNTPETEAILTLVIVACIMTGIGIYILLNREFLGDDPARTQ
jgi:ABC-2 type transport system permease protein